MKVLFFSLLTLLGAVALGLLAYQDPGYVLLSRGNVSYELSLTLFLLILAVSFVALYFFIRFLSRTWRLPRHLHQWRQHRRTRKAHRISIRGLIDLAQGRWPQAEKNLIKYAHYSEEPLLNYLSAARAAQKQRAHERRDYYLAQAHKSTPDADFAIQITQAELQLVHGQLEQSLATLVHLRSISPKHPHVLLLLMQLYEKLQNWGDLKDLLPALKKHKVITGEQQRELSIKVFTELLEIEARQNKAGKLEAFWKTLPRNLRQDTHLIKRYSYHLINMKQFDTATRVLYQAIHQRWDQDLIYLYGKAHSNKVDKQLAQAESWLKGHENNAILLLTLGRLCLYNQLWGKARSYLEASIGSDPFPETYRELGLLLEQLDEKDAAADCYRKGIMLGEKLPC
ncbi:MAG TPA: heme biosynthesis protein HemY [Gammaproteobacteria bacterium]|nr:heme biosynthesis protein HemY [Gammaproteobacteria bacterium]